MFTGHARVDRIMQHALHAAPKILRKDGKRAVQSLIYNFSDYTHFIPEGILGRFLWQSDLVIVRPIPPRNKKAFYKVDFCAEEVLLTLFHELGHAWFGHKGQLPYTQAYRLCEVQAESIALICYEFFLGEKGPTTYLDIQTGYMEPETLHDVGVSVPLMADAAYAIIQAFLETGWDKFEEAAAPSPVPGIDDQMQTAVVQRASKYAAPLV